MHRPTPPQVSVVMPIRDAEATLVEALDTTLSQSLADIELIAVDDQSSDRGPEILARHARGDARLRVISNPGGGLVPALNAGLNAARAPLVARMDADDRMHPQRLALQSQALTSRPDLSLIGTQARLFPEYAIRAGYAEYMRWQNACVSVEGIADNIYVESPFAHPTVMFRREAVRQLGGYRQGDFPEDYDLWLRMHAAGLAMAKIPRVLLDWRESPKRTSRVDPRYAREAFDRLRAHYLGQDPRLSTDREVVVWGAGRRTRQRVRLLSGTGVKVGAFIDIDPKKIGRCYDDAPVFDPEWLKGHRRGHGERPLVLVYVTSHGARERIAEYLEALQYRCGRDYLAVG